MKKGLRLAKNLILNKDQIKSAYLAPQALILAVNYPEEYAQGQYRVMLESAEIPEMQYYDVIVSIQEYKRIQREVEEYFGLKLEIEVEEEELA